MRVRYENTVEDLAALNAFHATSSPYMRRQYNLVRWGIPAVVVSAALMAALFGASPEWIVWAVIFGGTFAFLYRRSYGRSIRKAARALYREGRNENVLCEHELEIIEDGLIERTASAETRTGWSGIERIESTDEYTFIYVQAVMAHVVPWKRLIEGEREPFLVALHSAKAKHARGPSAATTSVLLLATLALLLASCGDAPAPTADAFPVPAWAKVAPEQIAEAKKHGVPVACENEMGTRFVLIPAGTFLMGSPESEEGRLPDEKQHRVTISRPFYMGISEVSNGTYRRYRSWHRSDIEVDLGLDVASHVAAAHPVSGATQPAVEVDWEDAEALARCLTSADPGR